MNWRDKPPGGRRGYHHGNLREALIAAALALISEKGAAGFSFADVARAAGVSPAAPYRHFRDRDALMAAVAAVGFDAFEQALSSAWNGGKPDPVSALDAVGQAYLAFARNEPAFYAAMFEAGIPASTAPELKLAGDRAFAVLLDAVTAVVATFPPAERPPVMMMSLHIWATTHGIASLFGRGDAGRRAIPMSPAELLEAATLIYLRGVRK